MTMLVPMTSHDCAMQQPLAQYRVAKDGSSITFYPCETTSHNRNDVKNRYCAKCHRFIADLWRPGDDPKKFYDPRLR